MITADTEMTYREKEQELTGLDATCANTGKELIATEHALSDLKEQLRLKQDEAKSD